MPKVRLVDTYRVRQGVSVPGADPSIRLRGEFVEVSEEDLARLRSEIGEGGIFDDLTEENLEVEGAAEESVPSPSQGLIDAVGQSTAENLAAAGFATLEEARDASRADLLAVTLVGESTIDNKIYAEEAPSDAGEEE